MAKEATATLSVSGWHCGGCSAATEASLKKVGGVTSAKAELLHRHREGDLRRLEGHDRRPREGRREGRLQGRSLTKSFAWGSWEGP
ncbi:MAG: heavy-metal-associated domain-containing protein [Myxococcales bacterium]